MSRRWEWGRAAADLSEPGALEALSRQLAARNRTEVPALDLGLRASAVLLPIIREPTATRLLFIVRQADLKAHSGQIAFPGGKRDETDTSVQHTALRESFEEVGLGQHLVTVCGLLDDVPTPARFNITPVVGALEGPWQPVHNPAEVAATLQPTLQALVAGYRLAGHSTWRGVHYAMHEFHCHEGGVPHRIWGATARMTYQLLSELGHLPPPPPDHLP